MDYSFVRVIAPGDDLEFRFAAPDGGKIESFPVSGTGTNAEDGVHDVRFGLTSPPTEMLSEAPLTGKLRGGFGCLDGSTWDRKSGCSFFFGDGIDPDAGLTLSFETSPIPLPASGLLLGPVLLAVAARAEARGSAYEARHGTVATPLAASAMPAFASSALARTSATGYPNFSVAAVRMSAAAPPINASFRVGNVGFASACQRSTAEHFRQEGVAPNVPENRTAVEGGWRNRRARCKDKTPPRRGSGRKASGAPGTHHAPTKFVRAGNLFTWCRFRFASIVPRLPQKERS